MEREEVDFVFKDEQETEDDQIRAELTSNTKAPSNLTDPLRSGSKKLEVLTDKMQEELFQQMHSWDMLEEFIHFDGKKCVLVQNIPSTASLEKVIMHFQSRKRANGGDVNVVIRMNDGLLIVFRVENDSASCLTKHDQKLGNSEIVLYPKTVPTYCEKKLVFQDVADQISTERLTLSLEECSASGKSPPKCIKCDRPGVYLIECGQDFDTADAKHLLNNLKIAMSHEKNVKVKFLCRTDCLKITYLPEETSDDEIKLAFNNNVVTKIDRCDSHTVLVYFTSFSDAETLQSMYSSHEKRFVIKGCEANLLLYYHLLSCDHEKLPLISTPVCKENAHSGENTGVASVQSNLPLQLEPSTSPVHSSSARLSIQQSPTENRSEEIEQISLHSFNPQCDENILIFVYDHIKHWESLKSRFDSLATIELVPRQENENAALCATPKLNLTECSQQDFEKMCQEYLNNFFSKYLYTTKKFDESKLLEARSRTQHCPEIKECNTESIQDQEFVTRWVKGQPIVCVAGLRDEVNDVMERIENCINRIVATLSLKPEEYGSLIHCGIIKKLREQSNSILIDCNVEKFTVDISGPKPHVDQAHIDALSALTGIQKKKLIFPNHHVLEFLSIVLSKKTAVAAKIQQNLNSDGIDVYLTIDADGEPCLMLHTPSDEQRAMDAIMKFVAVGETKINQEMSNVLGTLEWFNFRENLISDGKCSVFVKNHENVGIVALCEDVRDKKKKIESFLDENIIVRKHIRMKHGKARFIEQHYANLNTEPCEMKSVKCSIATDKDGLYIEAKKKTINSDYSEVVKLKDSIKCSALPMNEPGVKEYCQTEDGKELLSSVEAKYECVIITALEGQSKIQFHEKLPRAIGVSGFAQTKQEGSELVSTVSENGLVTLKVVKTGPRLHKCDAVIIPCDSDLDMVSDGVSGVIRVLDSQNGDRIRSEMKIEGNGKDLGDAFITPSHDIVACTHLIHVIAPRWDLSRSKSDPGLILKACIENGLKSADKQKFKSIAVPAVSCGSRGGEVERCVDLILEAVNEYFAEAKKSRIKSVIFIDNDRRDILDEFVKCVNEHQGQKPDSMVLRKLKSIRRKSTKHRPPEIMSFAQSEGPIVKLEQGNIADQTADVIVRVSLTGIARLWLYEEAQSDTLANISVWEEYVKLVVPNKPGKVLVTSAVGLKYKKVYHAFLANYDASKSMSSYIDCVRTVVSECLKMVNLENKSIVFPAIGTGEFCYPPLLVAKLMRQEISKFSGENLRTVTILLQPDNDIVIHSFRYEFQRKILCAIPATVVMKSESKKLKQKDVGSFFQVLDDSSAVFGHTLVSVREGIVTGQCCDVIVNITDDNFQLKTGETSKAILRTGGMEIQNEAEASEPENGYKVTSGGNLPCRKIIHLVEPRNEKDLRKKIMAVLRVVNEWSMKSVAFSTFGQDINVELVPSVLTASIQKFAKKDGALDTIHIVLFDDETIERFKNGLFQPQPGKNAGEIIRGLFNKGKDFGRRVISSTSTKYTKTVSEHYFELSVYSTTSEIIKNAMDHFQNEIKKLVQKEVITDGVIGHFTEMENYEIQQVERKYNVRIENVSGKYLSKLEVTGLSTVVQKAVDDIKEIIANLAEAEMFSTYVTWQKKSQDARWMDYPPRAACILEKAHKAKNLGDDKSTSPIIRVTEFVNGDVLEDLVDLSKLDESSPKIRRIPREMYTGIPDFWTDMDNTQFKIVDLSSGSAEYTDVLSRFEKGQSFHSSIIKIERVQNLSLYKQYLAKKTEVQENRRYLKTVEKKLFHGTSEDEKIMQQGFDRSFAGKNATVYGRGVYFAVDPTYSNRYTSPNGSDHRRMFLANVVTGDFCKGKETTTVPPPRNNGQIENDLYDSVVDDVSNPSIFVVFKDASAYPAYRITYTI